jgi:hypothetical protein
MVSYYHLYQNSNKQWYWRYVASNGKIIADSAEGYHNKADAENGIRIMKNSGSSVTV